MKPDAALYIGKELHANERFNNLFEYLSLDDSVKSGVRFLKDW
jgi:hypothetical protein